MCIGHFPIRADWTMQYTHDKIGYDATIEVSSLSPQ